MRRIALATAAVLALAACEGEATETDEQQAVDPPTAAQTEAEPQPEPEPEDADVDDAPPLRQDVMAGPPADEIGASVTTDPILLGGDDVVVAITGMTVYSTGAEVRIAVRTHPDAQGQEEGEIGADPLAMTPRATTADEGDAARLAFIYPDGTQAATDRDPFATGADPDGPSITHASSQGGAGTWDYELWLRPLPEPGDEPLEIALEWPAEGIEDSSTELPVEELTGARDRVVELWR